MEEKAKTAEPSKPDPFAVEELRKRIVGVIYGLDDRKDLGELAGNPAVSSIRAAADAVFGVFHARAVRPLLAVGPMTLVTESLDSRYGVKPCPGEAFADQPAGPFCTAFLVSATEVVTATHCFRDVGPDEVRFVRGFENTGAGVNLAVDRDQVYRGQLRDREPQSEWSVVTLERPVTGAAPLVFAEPGEVGPDAAVYALGFPLGVPLKHVGGARIHAVEARHIVTDLDAFSGMSGGPVLDATSHRLVGIVVNGSNTIDVDTAGPSMCWRTVTTEEQANEYAERPPDPGATP